MSQELEDSLETGRGSPKARFSGLVHCDGGVGGGDETIRGLKAQRGGSV